MVGSPDQDGLRVGLVVVLLVASSVVIGLQPADAVSTDGYDNNYKWEKEFPLHQDSLNKLHNYDLTSSLDNAMIHDITPTEFVHLFNRDKDKDSRPGTLDNPEFTGSESAVSGNQDSWVIHKTNLARAGASYLDASFKRPIKQTTRWTTRNTKYGTGTGNGVTKYPTRVEDNNGEFGLQHSPEQASPQSPDPLSGHQYTDRIKDAYITLVTLTPTTTVHEDSSTSPRLAPYTGEAAVLFDYQLNKSNRINTKGDDTDDRLELCTGSGDDEVCNSVYPGNGDDAGNTGQLSGGNLENERNNILWYNHDFTVHNTRMELLAHPDGSYDCPGSSVTGTDEGCLIGTLDFDADSMDTPGATISYDTDKWVNESSFSDDEQSDYHIDDPPNDIDGVDKVEKSDINSNDQTTSYLNLEGKANIEVRMVLNVSWTRSERERICTEYEFLVDPTPTPTEPPDDDDANDDDATKLRGAELVDAGGDGRLHHGGVSAGAERVGAAIDGRAGVPDHKDNYTEAPYPPTRTTPDAPRGGEWYCGELNWNTIDTDHFQSDNFTVRSDYDNDSLSQYEFYGIEDDEIDYKIRQNTDDDIEVKFTELPRYWGSMSFPTRSANRWEEGMYSQVIGSYEYYSLRVRSWDYFFVNRSSDSSANKELSPIRPVRQHARPDSNRPSGPGLLSNIGGGVSWIAPAGAGSDLWIPPSGANVERAVNVDENVSYQGEEIPNTSIAVTAVGGTQKQAPGSGSNLNLTFDSGQYTRADTDVKIDLAYIPSNVSVLEPFHHSRAVSDPNDEGDERRWNVVELPVRKVDIVTRVNTDYGDKEVAEVNVKVRDAQSGTLVDPDEHGGTLYMESHHRDRNQDWDGGSSCVPSQDTCGARLAPTEDQTVVVHQEDLRNGLNATYEPPNSWIDDESDEVLYTSKSVSVGTKKQTVTPPLGEFIANILPYFVLLVTILIAIKMARKGTRL